MSLCVSLSCESYRSAPSENAAHVTIAVRLTSYQTATRCLCIKSWIRLNKMYMNYTCMSLTPIVVPMRAPHLICVKRLIEKCQGVRSVGADDDYYGSVWTACTVLQLSESAGNPWGKLTPTLNYRLALTSSLSAHQLANPPSHQPSLTLLPPHSPSRHPLPAALSLH